MAAISTASGAQHLRRRGTTLQVAAFKGALGEVVVDTTYWRAVANDGSSTGGFPSAKATYTAVADTNYTIQPTDAVVNFTSFTAARTLTLPSATTYPPGQVLSISDTSGQIGSSAATITTFSTTEHINGATSFTLSSAFVGIHLVANSTALTWTAWGN